MGRAGFEPATTCDLRFLGACQAGILTRLDDRPMAAENGFRKHKDPSRTAAVECPTFRVCSSHESHSVNVLVLPRVASNLGRRTKAACGTFLLPNVIGVSTASAASNVSLASAS